MDENNIFLPDDLNNDIEVRNTAEQVVKANKQRNEKIKEPFDPIMGLNAPPQPRFLFAIEDVEWLLPSSMQELEIITELQKLGSIKAFCKEHKLNGMEEYVKWQLTYQRCRHDFCFWAATCCTVKDKRSGRDIKFSINRPQRKTLTALEEMRLADKPIRMIILKARQWGGSTLVQMYMAWIQLMLIEGRNSAIVAHINSSSLNIRAMYKRLIENYPPKMLGLPSDTKLELAPFNASRTDYTIKHSRDQVRNMIISVGSMQTPDSIRGSDVGLVHFSEVGVWKKTENRTPEEVIQATQSSVIAEPLTMVVMESTAKGEGNLFHKEWLDAKSGSSDKYPIFIPWREIENYNKPFDNQQQELDFAIQLVKNAKEPYAKNTRSEPGSYLWRLWNDGSTLEGLHWYIEQRKAYRDHDSMASEFPSDDIEAFAHSGSSVFDADRIEDLRKDCSIPIARGEIRGQALEGKEALKQLKFYNETHGDLKIWEFPDTSFRHRDRYIVSVDIGGRGVKADWSVIVVLDRWPRTQGKGDKVVAEWHGHIRHDLLAWKMAQIAAFYDDALLVVESNTFETRDAATEGEHSAFILDRIGQTYRNLYARETGPESVRKGKPGRKWGFHTNTRTKPLIIDNLTRIIEEHLYIEREEETLHEYRVYQRDNNGETNAAEGEHDDRVMARAIGLYVSDNMPQPRKVNPHMWKQHSTTNNKKRMPTEADF